MSDIGARRFVAIGVVVILVSLAGCSGFFDGQSDPSPEVTTTESSSSPQPTDSQPTATPTPTPTSAHTASAGLNGVMPSAADLPGEYTFLGASSGTEATGRTLVHDFEYTGTDDQQFPARLTVSVERFTAEADTGAEYDAIETSLEESYGSDLAELNLTDGPTVAYLDVQVDDGDHFASVIFRDGDTVVLVLAEDTTDFDLSPLFETSRTTKQRLSE